MYLYLSQDLNSRSGLRKACFLAASLGYGTYYTFTCYICILLCTFLFVRQSPSLSRCENITALWCSWQPTTPKAVGPHPRQFPCSLQFSPTTRHPHTADDLLACAQHRSWCRDLDQIKKCLKLGLKSGDMDSGLTGAWHHAAANGHWHVVQYYQEELDVEITGIPLNGWETHTAVDIHDLIILKVSWGQ